MDEELLLCKYCGGEVSSFAKTCPHCGSYNFHPDSYIKRRIIEEKERDRKYQEQIEKQKGPELRVEAVGDRCPPQWQSMIEFDGRRFSQLATRTVQFSDTDYPTHLRLVPGQHTVSYVNLELLPWSLPHPHPRNKSKSFTIYENSHTIWLVIQKGLFSDFVTVKPVTVD